jgi:hypothetical protein
MIGIGKPTQFGREVAAAVGSGDFVGFSGFAGAQKARNTRAARRMQQASPTGGR